LEATDDVVEAAMVCPAHGDLYCGHVVCAWYILKWSLLRPFYGLGERRFLGCAVRTPHAERHTSRSWRANDFRVKLELSGLGVVSCVESYTWSTCLGFMHLYLYSTEVWKITILLWVNNLPTGRLP
jgi:hypothetical protein